MAPKRLTSMGYTGKVSQYVGKDRPLGAVATEALPRVNCLERYKALQHWVFGHKLPLNRHPVSDSMPPQLSHACMPQQLSWILRARASACHMCVSCLTVTCFAAFAPDAQTMLGIELTSFPTVSDGMKRASQELCTQKTVVNGEGGNFRF